MNGKFISTIKNDLQDISYGIRDDRVFSRKKYVEKTS